jgi:hypothetical protein
LAPCLRLLCLPWSLSCVLLSGLVRPVVLASVALGLAVAGSVRFRLFKLASSALLPSGGWVVVGCFLFPSLHGGSVCLLLKGALYVC